MNTHSMCFSGVLRTVAVAGFLCLAVSYTSLASAAQGCGFGYHRGFYNGCVLNRPGPGSVPAPMHPGCWRNAHGVLRCG